MIKHFKHSIPLYQSGKTPIFNVLYFDEEGYDKVKQLYRKNHDEDKEELEPYKSFRGYSMTLTKDKKDTFWLLFPTRIPLTINTIGHECYHAVSGICVSRGMEIDANNDEAQAYLYGYIIEKVYEDLKSYIITNTENEKTK